MPSDEMGRPPPPSTALGWLACRARPMATAELNNRHGIALRLAAIALVAFGVLQSSTLISKERPNVKVSTSVSNSNRSSKVQIGWAGPALQAERPQSRLSTAEAKKFANYNSGNMIWAWGAQLLLNPDATELVGLMEPPHTAAVHAVLMPTANMLVNSSNHKIISGYTTFMTKVVRQQTMPIMLIGIGSQVEFSDLRPSESGHTEESEASLEVAAASQIKLAEEQVSFLKSVQLSEGFVGTRGRLTAAIMTTNGLAPPLVLGCPSLFLNHNPRLGTILQQKWEAVLRQRNSNLRLAVTMPAVHTAVPGELEDFFRPIVHMLSDQIFKVFPNSVAILQTKRDIYTLDWLEERHNLWEGRVRYYYDADSWVASMRNNFDFVIGFRIHGTMAGVAAEVPGLVIATDLRIKELADSMAIPAMDMDNLKPESFNLFEFIESAPGYGKMFDVRRQEVAKVYAREFERLGVPLSPGIAAIAHFADV